jgi:hypothetical protein
MIMDLGLFLLKNEQGVLFNAPHVSCRFRRHETWHGFYCQPIRPLADPSLRL